MPIRTLLAENAVRVLAVRAVRLMRANKAVVCSGLLMSVIPIACVEFSGPATPPVGETFVLTAVDGRKLPAAVSTTSTGQAIVVYSGGVGQIARSTTECNFYVKMDASGKAWSNEVLDRVPVACHLTKGETLEFTHTFANQNPSYSLPPPKGPHLYRFE